MVPQAIGISLRNNWVFDVPDKYKSRLLIDPRHVHLIATKHILRYLKGTFDYGLKYEANPDIKLEGCVDSYWESNAIDRKSTSGCCFSMGSCVVSWFSMN